MCDIDHIEQPHLNRRDMLALAGAAGAAVTAGSVLTADPAVAASDLALDPTKTPSNTADYEQPDAAADTPGKETALNWIDNNEEQILGLNDRIWEYAEPSLAEWNSSWAEAEFLRRRGFSIEWGVAGLPTAFVATFSHGSGPTVGFSGEYDALPGLSQEKGNPEHTPLEYHHDPYAPTYGYGHGCGHNSLGTAAAAAAVAVSQAMQRQSIGGTLKFFGSTAEEQLIGKSVAVKAGVYDGLDVFVDWHPGSSNGTSWGSSNALSSQTFHFLGTDGHGGSPLSERSTQDAVQAMGMLTEFLRESYMAPSARMHYAIRQTGQAPNVYPTLSSIWFYTREGSPERAQMLMKRVEDCAEAAALATGTRLQKKIVGGCWNQLGNKRGAELMHANMQLIGAPKFNADDQKFGKALQGSNGMSDPTGFDDTIRDLEAPSDLFLGGGSTDVADISWNVPTISMGTAHEPSGVKNHSWHRTACGAAHAGHLATLAAAKYLASTTIDLLTQPDVLDEIKSEFETRTKHVEWKSMLPDDFEVPAYEPPAWFLQRTKQTWPPKGVTWPPKPIVSTEPAPSLGAELPPANLPPLD